MRILNQFKAKVDGPLFRATGPSIHLGDETFGAAKSWGLFPGLEFLSGPETSSNPRDLAPPNNDRFTPHPNKVTAPFMAVTISPESKLPPTATGFYYSPDSVNGRVQAAIDSPRLLPSKTAQPLAHLGSWPKMGRPSFSANRTLCFTESARAGKQPSPRAFHSLDSHPCTRVSGRQFPTLSSRD